MTDHNPQDPSDPSYDPELEGEIITADDRIIGKALRWSLAVFAVLGLGIFGTATALRRPEPKPVIEARAPQPPLAREAEVSPPVVRFTDITSAAGIAFVHENGADGRKLLPETMGGGCAFLDHDGDGDADLLLVNSTYWPDSKKARSRPATPALYRNDGGGRFTDVTRTAGLARSFYGMGVAAGDYDGDGDCDLFFTSVGSNLLYRNDGGRFVDVTARAGVAGDARQWATSAGFFDYDRDGDLDLFVCRYVRWSPEIDFAVDYQLTGIGRAYGPPTNFEGSDPLLYRNNGDGTFADVTESAGIRVKNPATGKPMGKGLAFTLLDYDRNGWLDVLVANDTVQKFLFRNLGDGTFREVGAETGTAFDSDGNATGAMGIDAAHYRNDTAIGVAIGNFANEMTSFYVTQNEAGQFADEAITEGIGPASRERLTFGLLFLDYDLDARLDLFQANGHIEDEISVVQASQTYEQPAQLFWNCGPERSRCFVPVDEKTAGDLARPLVGRGASAADIDLDGDLDLVITQVAGPPLLLRNDQETKHHWIRVTLRGRAPNRDAIGALVELREHAGEASLDPQTPAAEMTRVQRRMVNPTRSYLSQVELPLTFGLGASDVPPSLRIVWPDGSEEVVELPGVDRAVVVEQGVES